MSENNKYYLTRAMINNQKILYFDTSVPNSLFFPSVIKKLRLLTS